MGQRAQASGQRPASLAQLRAEGLPDGPESEQRGRGFRLLVVQPGSQFSRHGGVGMARTAGQAMAAAQGDWSQGAQEGGGEWAGVPGDAVAGDA